jgi:hypothetical protein
VKIQVDKCWVDHFLVVLGLFSQITLTNKTSSVRTFDPNPGTQVFFLLFGQQCELGARVLTCWPDATFSWTASDSHWLFLGTRTSTNQRTQSSFSSEIRNGVTRGLYIEFSNKSSPFERLMARPSFVGRVSSQMAIRLRRGDETRGTEQMQKCNGTEMSAISLLF